MLETPGSARRMLGWTFGLQLPDHANEPPCRIMLLVIVCPRRCENMFSHSACMMLPCLLAACLCAGKVWSEPATVAQSRAEVLSAPVLLARFDRDADGTLDALEKKALCAAFGGVEVPMLPAEPYRYGLSDAPDQPLPDAQLDLMDNTPQDNPLTDAGASLGRVLFYDKQLSVNGTIACASCHLQQNAFSDPRRFSLGIHQGQTARNAMGLANLRFSNFKPSRPGFFWDERAATLEIQALMPIQDPVEMGMTLNDLEQKLQAVSYYPMLFEAAFGTPEVTSGRIAKALAQFMRALVSFDAKFDRGAKAVGDYSQNFPNFTAEENLGKSIFIDGVGGVGEIGCAHCHIPPTFNMPKAFNNGLDLQYKDRGLGARGLRSNDPFTPSNNGKFKAPSLRNIALTAPYMHDGRFTTLEQVIHHYSDAVRPHDNLGLVLHDSEPDGNQGTSGFRLTATQKSALIAFLKTLTDEKFITDPRFSDPFVRLSTTGESHERKP